MTDQEEILIKKVMSILNTESQETARMIVVEIGGFYESNANEELTQQLIQQSNELGYYIDLVRKLEGKITQLELSSGYRNGSTEIIKGMNIGEPKQQGQKLMIILSPTSHRYHHGIDRMLGQQARHQLGVTDPAVREDVARITREVGEVGGVARVREGVEHGDLDVGVLLDGLVHEVRTDEAGTAGNEYLGQTSFYWSAQLRCLTATIDSSAACFWNSARKLRDRRAARQGWDGRGVSCARHQARTRGRGQSSPRRICGKSRATCEI